MTDWYKIKRWLIRVNWVEKQFYPAGLQLNLKFDFSVDTWYWDYTYWDVAANGLVIQNNNWWVTNNSYGNANVYKVVNAKKVWTRILFNFNNISIANNNGWALWLTSFASVQNWPEVYCVNNSKLLRLSVQWQEKASTNINISLWTDYYLDFKFENWVYTWTIYDTSLNEIQSVTYTDTSVTSIDKIWFEMWNQWLTNSYYFCRIKKYREAYEV